MWPGPGASIWHRDPAATARLALRTAALRATVLRQALLSYLLGAVIPATTINLVAGLVR